MGQKSTDIDNLKKKKLNSDKENLEKETVMLKAVNVQKTMIKK